MCCDQLLNQVLDHFASLIGVYQLDALCRGGSPLVIGKTHSLVKIKRLLFEPIRATFLNCDALPGYN